MSYTDSSRANPWQGPLLLGLALAACTPTEPATPSPSPSPSHSAVTAASPSTAAADSAKRGEVDIAGLDEGVWLHTSWHEVPNFGSVMSNGLVVEAEGTLFLIDTAWTNADTRSILDWSNNTFGRGLQNAIVTHAHMDKMGGMDALHESGVITFAHPMTNGDAPKRGLTPATNTLVFQDDVATLADGAIEVFYPGAGHTHDNVVVYLKDTKILFGGCLIRPGESRTMGNTADGDTANWAHAVALVESRYPDARMVIPSHGVPGGRELLSHTIELARAHE